jgi:hypothetical protein
LWAAPALLALTAGCGAQRPQETQEVERPAAAAEPPLPLGEPAAPPRAAAPPEPAHTGPLGPAREAPMAPIASDRPLPPLPFVSFVPPRPPEVVRAVYAFAARRPDVLRYVPCFCGCEQSGHRDNEDCFVRGRTADGDPIWDDHGMG